jgi:hypothetical protein
MSSEEALPTSTLVDQLLVAAPESEGSTKTLKVTSVLALGAIEPAKVQPTT